MSICPFLFFALNLEYYPELFDNLFTQRREFRNEHCWKTYEHTNFFDYPDKFFYEAIDDIYKNRVSALLVEKEGEYIGIITKTDWMLLVLRGECDPKKVKTSSVMTKIKSTINENKTIAEACAIMEERKIRHLPVTREGKISGMFSVKDLEKYFLQLHQKTDF